MRLKLKLQHPINSLLPLNYQHYISACIYKILSKASPEFTTWLHDHGFETNGKKYKLFTFGRIKPQKYQIDGQRNLIQLLTDTSYLSISFYVDDALKHFVQGLFQAQHFRIGDPFIGTNFSVESVQVLAPPEFLEKMIWKTRSPICISQKIDTERYAQYLAPDHPDYGMLLGRNLYHKLKSVGYPHLETSPPLLQFKLLGDYRSKLIQIKNSQIRAYEFHFSLVADPKLQRMAYYAGFGEKNAQGFGLVIEK